MFITQKYYINILLNVVLAYFLPFYKKIWVKMRLFYLIWRESRKEQAKYKMKLLPIFWIPHQTNKTALPTSQDSQE